MFYGNSNSKNQCESLPFLLALLSMLINCEVNIEGKSSQGLLTLFGMVTYNTWTLKKSTHALNHRHHKKEHETPATMCVGLKLCSTVRSKTIVDHLLHLQILIFYDRMLSIAKSLYEVLRRNCAQYNIFLPINLEKGCFVVLVKDNIEKNASSKLVKSPYHGTSISLLRFPELENQGESLENLDDIDSVHKFKKLAPLAAEYTEAPKISHSSLPTGFYAPLCTYNFIYIQDFSELDSAKM